jgi:type I restriction enzyme S subunit
MSTAGMPGYKETSIGWIPDSWPVRSLEAISTDNITYGVVQPGPEDKSGVRLVRGGDVKKGRVSTALRTISSAVSNQFSRTVLRGGELLVSLVGYPGETAIAGKELAGANIARQVGLVRLCDSNNSHFVQQYLSSPIGKKVLLGGMIGSAQQVINLNALREVEVPLPQLPEQQKIAAILTAVDDKLDVIARQIEATQTLKQGLMQTLFSRGVGTQDADGRWVPHAEFKDSEMEEIPVGWEVAKLNAHASKVGSGVTPKGGSDSYLSSGIPLIRSQNVLVGSLSLDDVVFISSEQHEKMRNSALSPNDVLLNITGASIGRCAVLPADFEVGNVNQHVCIIRTDVTLSPHFLCQYLNSEMGQKQIGKFQAGGIARG